MAARSWSVKTIDSKEADLQRQDIFRTTVAELVKDACEKMGLPNHEEFSFAALNKCTSRFKRKRKVWNASNNESKLLNPKKSLKEQGINEAEALTLTLRKRLFFTETTCCSCDSRDEKELNLTYLELQNALISEFYGCTISCDKAIKLAALQCCIEDENNMDEDFLDRKLNSLLPCKYAKVQGITSTISEAYNSLDRELRESSNKAKSEYIRLCTTLDGFGITLFSGKESTKKRTKQKLVKCYLGITHNSVWRIEAKSCEVLEKWPIVSIKRWSQSRNNILVTLILNNDKSYIFWPSGECDAIIQLLDDYADMGNRYSRSQRNSSLPVRSGEDLTIGPGSNPSLNCSSPFNSRTHASATRSTLGGIRSGEADTPTISITRGDSATDPSSENPPTSTEGGIRSGKADTPTISIARGDFAPDPSSENPPTEGGVRSREAATPSVSIARGDSAVNPINNGETDSPGVDTHDIRSETGDSSEEESPIRNIRDHLTLTKLRSVRNRTWEARSRWQNIGIELKLEKTDLDAINLKNGSDTDACFGEMLSMWLKQTRSQPTWSKMIRALKTPAVGFQELAEHIEMNSVTKQSVELHQFPHNNIMSEADEENQEELEGRLREQTRDIIREFNILKQKLFDTLEDYTVQRLNRYLKVYGAENFKSIDDVQNFIEKNSSFCDYEIVKYIIHLAGAEKDEQCLQEYEKCFEVYAQSRVYKIQCPSTIDASPTSPDSLSSKLCIKLDSEYDEVQRNPNKLKQLQCRLCNLLKIPVCKLVSIEPD